VDAGSRRVAGMWFDIRRRRPALHRRPRTPGHDEVDPGGRRRDLRHRRPLPRDQGACRRPVGPRSSEPGRGCRVGAQGCPRVPDTGRGSRVPRRDLGRRRPL